MFLDSVGIILKKNDSSMHKVTILDKIHGKIECVTLYHAFSVGSLITYIMRCEKSVYFINDISLIYTPLSLAQVDILFFHHILELVYHFTHVGNYTNDLFNLFAFLYATEQNMITALYKKFFLLKLLSCMDTMPEQDNLHTSVMAKLNNTDIKHLVTISINKSDEQELDRWLWSCVWQHPYVNKFKTVHFLAENRTV